jgi:hypothetical protein
MSEEKLDKLLVAIRAQVDEGAWIEFRPRIGHLKTGCFVAVRSGYPGAPSTEHVHAEADAPTQGIDLLAKWLHTRADVKVKEAERVLAAARKSAAELSKLVS